MKRSSIAFSIVVISASPGVDAQDDARPPGAAGILRESAEACRRLAGVRYTLVQRPVDPDSEGPSYRANVLQVRQTDAAGLVGLGLIRVEGTRHQGSVEAPFAWSYDGSAVRVLRESERSVLMLRDPKPSDAVRLVGQEYFLMPLPAFTQDAPFSYEGSTVTATHKGTATVDGVECDLVAVEVRREHPQIGAFTTTSTWGFGLEDRLPRWFETDRWRTEIHDLVALADVDAIQLGLSTPEGFAEVEYAAGFARTEGLLSPGQPAPTWSLRDADGRIHELEDFQDRVLLLDFWGTWCAPCIAAMPKLQALHERFRGQGLVVIGVSSNEREGADPAAFMEERGFTYMLLLNGETITADYRVRSFPTVYVIGKDGRIIHGEIGNREGAEDQLAAIIRDALGGSRISVSSTSSPRRNLEVEGTYEVSLSRSPLPMSRPLVGLSNLFFEAVAEPDRYALPSGVGSLEFAALLREPPIEVVRFRVGDETSYVVDTDGDRDLREEKPLAFETDDTLLVATCEVNARRVGDFQAVVTCQVLRADGEGYVYGRVAEEWTGTLRIGSSEHKLVLRPTSRSHPYPDDPEGKQFLVDLDSNGEFASSWSFRDGHPVPPEEVAVGQPFLLGGRPFQVTAVDPLGQWLRVAQVDVTEAAAVGFKLPDAAFLDLSGRQHRLSDYGGRPLLLEFWSINCPRCKSIREDVARLIQKGSDRNLVSLAFHVNGPRDQLEASLEENPRPGIIVQAPRDVVQLFNPEIATPTFYLVDEAGVIRVAGRGTGMVPVLDRAIGNW